MGFIICAVLEEVLDYGLGFFTNLDIIRWWDNSSSSYDVTVDSEASLVNNNIILNHGNENEDEDAMDIDNMPQIEEMRDEEEDSELGEYKPIKWKQTLLIEKPEIEITEDQKVLILKDLKIGNEGLKRKREETEDRRKKEKRKKKSKHNDRYLGCKGFVNKTLITQISLITNNNKDLTRRVIRIIYIVFLKYIEDMYKSFWLRENKRLEEEGIADTAIIKRIKDIGKS